MAAKKEGAVSGAGGSPYLARPASGVGPGVLVLHAWWGLTPFFRGFCDRLAGKGFLVLAPDLYDGATASTIEQAQKLRSKLKRELLTRQIVVAAEELGSLSSSAVAPQRAAGQPGIGVVGFSLGGHWALWLADQPSSPVAATTVFYGSRGGEYTESRSAFQFHLAETDPYESASGIERLRRRLKAAGREAEFHTYPGTTHWFFESDRPDAYRPEAAELAWRRTVEFLGKHLA